MKLLVACEQSQRIANVWREAGHIAYSCDIVPSSGGHPEYHIMGDCLPLLNGNCSFVCEDGSEHEIIGNWDIIIAHPPCTYLTVSGNRWFNVEKYGDKARKRLLDREEAIAFFMRFANADCDRIAIENPIGCMSRVYRKPDQIINPFQFGDPVRKPTCLWLKGLSPLLPTNIVEPDIITDAGGNRYSGPAYYARDENGKILAWNDPRTKAIRSVTYEGIAKATLQWSK